MLFSNKLPLCAKQRSRQSILFSLLWTSCLSDRKRAPPCTQSWLKAQVLQVKSTTLESSQFQTQVAISMHEHLWHTTEFLMLLWTTCCFLPHPGCSCTSSSAYLVPHTSTIPSTLTSYTPLWSSLTAYWLTSSSYMWRELGNYGAGQIPVTRHHPLQWA